MKYTEISELLEKNQQEIIEHWEERAKKEIESLKKESKISTRDHLLFYLKNLIETIKNLNDIDPRKQSDKEFIPEFSEQHGRIRASVKGYKIDELIHEYALLRQVVTDFLENKKLLNISILEALNRINEKALLSGVYEFNQSITKTRGKIASSLIHDIRNPLAAVRICLELMNKSRNSSDFEKFSTRAMSAVDRIDKMTAEILDSIKVDAGHILELDFKDVNLCESLALTFDSIRMTYPNRFVFDITSDSITGKFGVEGICRLVENLAVNAVKYGDLDREITIRLKCIGNEVIFEVHNWGKPIDEKGKENIFLSINNSENISKYSTQGWGIGLTFVRAVVDAHQGKLEVTSTEEEGTTFRVKIPRNHPNRNQISSQKVA